MSKLITETDKPISWVTETYDSNGQTEVRIIREGMSKQEIENTFPPHWNDKKGTYNRAALIRAIIWEAYQENRQRPRRNIRGFYYERIKHIVYGIMGDSGSIDSTINDAWEELVEGGYLTYRDMNLYSEKENSYHIAVNENSPYPRVIVLVEKASLFEDLRDLADTYQISFVCTGGQSSRAAAMAYVHELEKLGVDTSEPFTVFSFTDFNPAGWEIPEGFIKHLKIKASGDVNLIRLGLLKEQLGESVIMNMASPYSFDARTKKARKLKITKYDRFKAQAGEILVPSDDNPNVLVPGQVDIDIYTPTQIKAKILAGMAQHLDVSPYQVNGLKKALEDAYADVEDCIYAECQELAAHVYKGYFDAIKVERDAICEEMKTRAVEERKRKAELLIELKELEDVIANETEDLSRKSAKLDDLENKLLTMQSDAANDAYFETLETLPFSDELIVKIESNGGWEHWAGAVGIERVDPDYMVNLAMRGERYSYKPDTLTCRGIVDWIQKQVEYEVLDVCEPELSPSEFIETECA